MRLWHGGVPGLRPGDVLVPGERHVVAGCVWCEQKARGEHATAANGLVVDPINEHEDRIYVTSDRAYARFYASKYVLGDLYQVEPVGELGESSEDPFPTWHVTSARVVQVAERAVRLTSAQRRTLVNRWKREDEKFGPLFTEIAIPAPMWGAGKRR